MLEVKDTDRSTFLGLVLLQDVLEVLEELLLVDPPVVSERGGKFVEKLASLRRETNNEQRCLAMWVCSVT